MAFGEPVAFFKALSMQKPDLIILDIMLLMKMVFLFSVKSGRTQRLNQFQHLCNR
jgi:DNA-binding response OmpR family regulator